MPGFVERGINDVRWPDPRWAPPVATVNTVVATGDVEAAPPIISDPNEPLNEPVMASIRAHVDRYWPDEDTAMSQVYRWTEARFNGLILQRYIDYAREYMTSKTTKKVDSKEPAFLDKTFKQFLGKRQKAVEGEIGLEIETEGRNLFSAPIQYWSAVPDGSLRSVEGHQPIEYVLRQPLARKDVRPALEYLTYQLRKAKSELVMSHRTSVHVHINIQKMNMLDLMKFISLYYLVEDMLLEWSGPDRKGNLFCLRAQDATFQIEQMAKALKGGEFSHVVNNEYRYAAMNLAALSAHGSLEFRSMKGNVDIETIENWVSILLALKDAATTDFKSPETIGRMYQSLGAKNFLVKVFDGRVPPKVLRTLLSYEGLDDMIHKGFVTCKDIIYAVDWMDPPRWMKSTTKEAGWSE